MGGGDGEDEEKEGKRRWEESERERARELEECSKRREEMEREADEVLRRRSSLEACNGITARFLFDLMPRQDAAPEPELHERWPAGTALKIEFLSWVEITYG